MPASSISVNDSNDSISAPSCRHRLHRRAELAVYVGVVAAGVLMLTVRRAHKAVV